MGWTIRDNKAEEKKETVTSFTKSELQDVKSSLQQAIERLDAGKNDAQDRIDAIDVVLAQING